jgi:hypothetical protein
LHAYIKYRKEYQTFLGREDFANSLWPPITRVVIRLMSNAMCVFGRVESSAEIRATSAMESSNRDGSLFRRQRSDPKILAMRMQLSRIGRPLRALLNVT